MTEILPCDVCGLPMDDGSHFSMGKSWCKRCYSGQRPPDGIMPPTPAYKRQIAAWMRPRTSTPPSQQTLAGVELAQPQGVRRG